MSLRVLGASVRGPAHARARVQNQDAWYARVSASGALAVVADGMGSRPEARAGAQAAVAACRAAFRHWAPARRGSGEDLVRLIEVLWRLQLGAIAPDDAATTCLVLAVRADGEGVALQLGDGVVGVLDASGSLRPIAPEREGFGSMTRALGTPHHLRDWAIAQVGPLTGNMAVLLATDGVADDLIPEQRAAFVRWLLEDVAASEAPGRRLAQALRAWPVPKHLDDKTVVALWEEAQ